MGGRVDIADTSCFAFIVMFWNWKSPGTLYMIYTEARNPYYESRVERLCHHREIRLIRGGGLGPVPIRGAVAASPNVCPIRGSFGLEVSGGQRKFPGGRRV